MKSFLQSDFAAFVGIDWADRKHDICCQPTSGKRELLQIQHTPEAIDAWAQSLLERFSDKPIAVCLELTKGPLVYALMKYPHLVLIPVNPAGLAQYRKTFTPSGAKDDPTDAELACDFVQRHFDRFQPLTPDSPEMRTLQELVVYRRKCVGDRMRISNRIVSALKNYYPQVLDWFNDRDTRVFCDFLTQWPSLSEVQRSRTSTLERFFTTHNVRRRNVIERRIEGIRSAQPLTDDPAALRANQLIVQTQVPQLKLMIQIIKQIDGEIAELCGALEDYELFTSLPAAGPVYTPRLLAAFGENRERFQSAMHVQQCSGVAPVLERSGKKSWVHWRYACSTFMRQSFVEWSGETVRYSFWAKAFYEYQKQKGKSHNTILRALAFKWIRILFHCWQHRVKYDESKYLNALKERNSPLLAYAVSQGTD